MRAVVLEFINKVVRSENGNRVSEDSKFTDAKLDSFGTAIFFMELDHEYDLFAKMGYGEGEDVLSHIDYANITIKEIINLCTSENITT